MAIVQCPNNHYYDDKRNVTCPYCEKMQSPLASLSELNEQHTSYLDPTESDLNVQLTEGYGEFVNEYERTIGIFMDETQNLLTVGWLVCVFGNEKGKNYTIHSGRNFAGRSQEMDIVLSDDMSIVREKHFSIVYDPKGIAFYLVAGEGHTYINGETISAEVRIFDGDEIQVGQSKYLFVPFCKEGRVWD